MDDPTSPEPRSKAVALAFDGTSAPRVTAKGEGTIADQIVKTAEASGVTIERNPALAEALSHVELDQEIPEAMYRAVAEVIRFVLKLGNAGR